MENFLGAILYGTIIYLIIKKRKEKKNEKAFENKQYKYIYNKKEKLLTDNEKLFYKVIKEITKDKEIIIQTQVVLYEIIETKKQNRQFNFYFNKIKAKSIDFVLVDNEFNILVCIELDDYTHNRPDRIKRDEFINQLFKETNTRLIRVPAQPYYNVDRIRKLIEECL